jgi:hypothetical protein
MDDKECKNATETALLQAGTPPHFKFQVPCSESYAHYYYYIRLGTWINNLAPKTFTSQTNKYNFHMGI